MTRVFALSTRPRRLALALALAFGSLCLLPAGAAQAAPAKTGVVAGSGSNSGGVLTAGEHGAEYQLPSQARLRLEPGAAVRIFPLSQPLQLAPGPKTTTWSFSLIHGRVDVSVPSRPKSAVLCSIGKLSAIVGSGGRATLLAHGDAVTVASVEGELRTLLGEHWQTLSAGTLAHFGGEHGTGTPEPAVAAPALAAGQRLWFAAGAGVALSGFAFNAVPAAHAYELRLRAQDDSAEELRRIENATRLSEAFSPSTPGEYKLAVRSIDAEGLAGPWSSESRLRVVGVSLPPGGYSAGGDIFVGPGQDVRFSHTDGLEMTYEGAGRYVPASEAVSLYRGETTVVSFRVPGSFYATSARLRPRSVYAHVAIGPSRAVWPQDPVEIVVEARTKNGATIPDWLELRPEVKLGIEPIEVSFTRQGNRLVGAVPPPDKPGPWVLRVEVKDQFGALLGRDFLEIAAATPSLPAKPVSARVASK